ncbi:MAG: glutathione peroxidase [Porphyromonadaceae bacterium]|jgi:glutathione peroxidase|nr:glutathione peroxidase [uncultured Macellibacteroides sp.]MCE5225778.1 glutathione peroxidase [Porphyromonadaceae bacterium]
MEKKFYSFKALSLKGKEISMDQYKGKVVVIVNTASKCGFTPQYADLEKLYQQYKDKGLVILGFPCNQFGKQEPGTAKDISEGCLINYGVSFPMFSKVDVNGNNAHPLFRYLKSTLPGFISNSVKWNFTKFVIDTEGNPVKRYAPITSPLKMEELIVSLLK